MAYIEFQNVIKEYRTGETRIRALDGAEFTIEKGELAVILGSSGAGKTTALNILGGMDTVTHGHVLIDGTDITAFHKRELYFPRQDIRRDEATLSLHTILLHWLLPQKNKS